VNLLEVGRTWGSELLIRKIQYHNNQRAILALGDASNLLKLYIHDKLRTLEDVLGVDVLMAASPAEHAGVNVRPLALSRYYLHGTMKKIACTLTTDRAPKQPSAHASGHPKFTQ
jgi:hypothetical protein